MELTLYSDIIEDYLAETDVVDYKNNTIMQLSNLIWAQAQDELNYIKRVYEFVRDSISHSADIDEYKVTCTASEVLKEKHGICFAKSHLLAALLRCKGIPAGFCYQRLILDDENDPSLVLHGLNGVYIKEYGKWIRLDARGNKAGVNAKFSTEKEYLAYPARYELGEQDILMIYPTPDTNVVNALIKCSTRQELWSNLPKQLAYNQNHRLNRWFAPPL